MPNTAKDRQISVRIAGDTAVWLERRLIERERARERELELELLKMFDGAAADITAEDREERESLLGGFAGRRRPEP